MRSISRSLMVGTRRILRTLGWDLVRREWADIGRLTELTAKHVVDLTPFVLATLRQANRQPFFVQIGANDGSRGDAFGPLIENFDLPGLLVEPQPDAFRELVRRYIGRTNLRFENVAIASSAGRVTMYRFDRRSEKHLQLDVYTSLDRARLEDAKARHRLQAGIESISVPALTVNDLLSRHRISDVSIFVIDTEGYDYEVIKLIDLPRLRPALIQFEHRLLAGDVRQQCYVHLMDAGYRLCLGRHDTFAVRPAHELWADRPDSVAGHQGRGAHTTEPHSR
jgi:FkbM family methyltransferase